jgi:hypothetical protein
MFVGLKDMPASVARSSLTFIDPSVFRPFVMPDSTENRIRNFYHYNIVEAMLDGSIENPAIPEGSDTMALGMFGARGSGSAGRLKELYAKLFYGKVTTIYSVPRTYSDKLGMAARELRWHQFKKEKVDFFARACLVQDTEPGDGLRQARPPRVFQEAIRRGERVL